MTDEELRRLFEVAREEGAASHAETRRLFEVTSESLRHEIRVVAEGVAHVEQKREAAAAALDEKIERTSRETQAMIKFSHAELSRRVDSLEELKGEVADLKERVERLESRPDRISDR